MKTEVIIKFKDIKVTIERDLEDPNSSELLGMYIQAAKAVGIEYINEESELEEEPKTGMFKGDKSIN